MKSWWLKLYTIPNFCHDLKRVGLVSLVGIGMSFVLPGLSYLWIALFLYPIYQFIGSRDQSLLHNISFHKANIPYRELQKALLIDFFFSTSAFVLVWLGGLYSTLFFLEKTDLFSIFASHLIDVTPTRWIFNVLGLYLLVFNFKYGAYLKRIMKEYSDAHYVAKRSKLTGYLLVVVAISVGIAVVEMETGGSGILGKRFSNIPEALLLYFGLLLMFGSMLLYGNKIIFHYEKNLFSKKEASRLGGASFAVPLVIFTVLGLVSRVEVESDFFSPQARLRTFEVFAPLHSPVDVVTAALYLKEGADSEVVFAHAAPEVWEVPFEQVYEGSDLYVWRNYLKFGKPTDESMLYMLREMETNKDIEAQKKYGYYRMINQVLVQHLQKANKLPSEYIHAHVKREVATEKE